MDDLRPMDRDDEYEASHGGSSENEIDEVKLESRGETPPLPGYLKQTFTSSSPAYSHFGNERIRNAFTSASCYSVKQIPAKLDHRSVQEARQAQLAEAKVQKAPRREVRRDRYFTPVAYGHSDFDAAQVKAHRDAEIRELNLISFSRKPFSLSSSKVKLKNEDIIDNENFVYPTLGPSDETLMYKGRGAELDKSKPKYGFFRPGGRATREQQLREEGRGLFPDWSRQMFTKLSEDWPQLRFKLQFTTEDEFLFSFVEPDPSGANSSGLLQFADNLNKYMKHFATHGLASEFRLIKRGDRWNCLEPVGSGRICLSPVRTREGMIASGSLSASRRDRGFRGEEDRARSMRDTEGGPQCPDERWSSPSQHPPKTVLVYSFYAPWVSLAQSKTRRVESLRSRVKARSGSLNLGSVLATGTSSS